MKFEFTPSKYPKSLNEFNKYLIKSFNIDKIFNMSVKVPYVIGACIALLAYLCAKFYMYFDFVKMLFIFGPIICIIVYFVEKKFSKRTGTKIPKIIKKNICDYNSTVYITIENDYLIRENKYSKIKIKLNEIGKIELLYRSVILYSKDKAILIFIPKQCLPIELEDFIKLFKEKNNNIIINNFEKIYKKHINKLLVFMGMAIILTTFFSYFVGKYIDENSFKKYDLKLENELEKVEFGESLYESENIGIRMYLPIRWNGKYGVEELNDRVNVYYLPKGVQSKETTLIFTLTKLQDLDVKEDMVNVKSVEKANGIYTFFIPKVIDTLGADSLEYIEYSNMIQDIAKMHIESI
ncbi:hypothetical protein [Clostridium baratii]|uniref:hypothetical protein n=1 Tax=Clostridium baratii TaxID=1561 RepID=UPI001C015FB1|nr:hypothetical protein [Clostridium baratii]MBT9832719.1 hypothetical protein [Clostridium baratii]